MMNCFTLATGTPSPPGSESGSSRRDEGPTSPPRRRVSPSALSARPRSWRSSVPWPWSPRGVESSWPRTRAPRPCGSRRGTCRRGRLCATRRSRATGAAGRAAGACVDFSEDSRRWRVDERRPLRSQESTWSVVRISAGALIARVHAQTARNQLFLTARRRRETHHRQSRSRSAKPVLLFCEFGLPRRNLAREGE